MNESSHSDDWVASQLIRQAFIDRSAYKEGDVVGRQYRVHRVLGHGGYGVVYLVTHLNDNIIMALKTYLDEFMFEEAVKNQFLYEARAWVNLNSHPFIVQAHHVRWFDRRMFVAMDFVAGDENGLVTLRDHIEHHGRNIGDRRIGMWTIEFCHAMEHVQSRGMAAHRDIKPTNLLVDRELLKVSDFGLATPLANFKKPLDHPNTCNIVGLSEPGTDRRTCGTPGYIAPEVVRGAGATFQSDNP
jgi:serine/threonine protein kinase